LVHRAAQESISLLREANQAGLLVVAVTPLVIDALNSEAITARRYPKTPPKP